MPAQTGPQAQVRPGLLCTAARFCEKRCRWAGLSSLPVSHVRGAPAEGIGAHRDLTFCLRGETQQVSAALRHGDASQLGGRAALEQTGEAEDRRGEEKRQVRTDRDGWRKTHRDGVQRTEIKAKFHVAHLLRTGGFFNHKPNLNFDLDCTTQSTLGRTQAKIHTQQHYSSGWQSYFKGIRPQKRAYFTFRRRAQVQRHTHTRSYLSTSQVGKANSFTTPQKLVHVEALEKN